MWNSKLTIRKTCLPAVDFQVAPTLHCVVFWWSSIEVLNRTLPRHLSVPVLLSRHSLLARHPSCLQRMPCSEVLFPTPLWCVLEMRALILLWWVNICVRSVVQCFNMGQYWYGMLMCCTHLFIYFLPQVWDASTGGLLQKLPADLPVMDICPFETNQEHYLASLTEKMIKIYKWEQSGSDRVTLWLCFFDYRWILRMWSVKSWHVSLKSREYLEYLFIVMTWL